MQQAPSYNEPEQSRRRNEPGKGRRANEPEQGRRADEPEVRRYTTEPEQGEHYTELERGHHYTAEPEQYQRDYGAQTQYPQGTPTGVTQPGVSQTAPVMGAGGAAVAGERYATGERRTGPFSWADRVRWGPIWAGLFTILATLAILGSLGTAIGVSVWRTAIPDGFSYFWLILTGILAYLLGGYVASRAAGANNPGSAILHGGLAWALSLLALIVLVLFGAGNLLGILGTNLATVLRGNAGAPGITPGNVAGTAWATFLSLVIGLILTIIGALLGMRAFSGMRGRTAGHTRDVRDTREHAV